MVYLNLPALCGALAIALISGCGQRASSAPDKSEPTSPTQETAVTPFDKARAHFAEAAARVQAISADTLEITPTKVDNGGEDYDSRRTGPLFAFQAKSAKGLIRGYAGADGTTALAGDGSLGALLAAAGIPGDAPTLDAAKMAHRLTWVLHPGFGELTSVGFQMLPQGEDASTRLEKIPGGGARLTWFVQQGGATGTVTVYKVEVTVDAAGQYKSQSTYMVPD